MNEKNVDYLKDQLKYLGFGEGLTEKLSAAIQEGKPSFVIRHEDAFQGTAIEAQLHFKQSSQTDLYFFNKYEAKLKSETAAELDRQHTFHINKGSSITLKEAFNLLQGRAVNKDLVTKEGQAYKAWVQLDLKQKDAQGQYHVNMYHQRYGFDLEKALAAHPIRELREPEQKDQLLKSLQKGNLQSVTVLTEVGQERRFIEAAPQFKSINQYDEQLRPIRNALDKAVEGNKQEVKSQAPKAGMSEEDTGPELKKNRTRKNGLSV